MKTLLLVEPHVPTLEHLRDALKQSGYTVHAVSEPGAAMEHFVSGRPDAVVLAVDLPKIDGASVGELIRNSDLGTRVPIVAIDKGHLGRAKGVGAVLELRANVYVADPLKLSELLPKLEAVLAAADSARVAATTGIHRVLARPPVAAGDLRGFALPPLMHSMFRLSRDGILAVAHRDLTRRVFLLKGVPISFDSTARQDGLPAWLVEHGDLKAEQAEAVLKSISGGLRIGGALAEAGVELQGEELLQRLRDFTREQVARAIGMRDGRYAFYAGDEFSQEVAAVEIPALGPILDGARRTYPLKVFAQALKGRGQEFPHRTAEFGRDLPALGLDRQDLKVAMQLNGRSRTSELLAHGRGDLRIGYSLLWFLQLAGDVAFSKTPVATGDSQVFTEPERIAPKRRKPLPAEIANELRDAAVKIITGSYFRVLGLDIAADTEAVERAYHETATRFHPDTYAEYDTSELQDLLESVQEKLSASYRVLSVDEKRKAYLQYLLSKLDVRRSSELNVEAEIALRRGEAALKRRDAKTALLAFEEAIALNPREAEYYSHLAWATYLAGEGDEKERGKSALKLLRKALGMNPLIERATIISAIIEGEMGDHAGARKKLLKVLEQNPNAALAKAALRKIGR